MKPMTCTDVDEHIELFAAGECAAPMASAIRRHLSGCVRCMNAEVEARQFMGMMDLRLQEPDRLQRLLDRIATESSPVPPIAPTVPNAKQKRRAMPVRSNSFASRQRWFALAASILLPIGIGIWLTPRDESPTPDVARTDLTLALLPDRSTRGHEKLMPPNAVDKAVTVQSLSFPFEPGGKTSKEFRSMLEEAAFMKAHKAPPEVDLTLQIGNPTNRPLLLHFDDPRAELRLSLTGPGVLRLDAPAGTDPFAGQRDMQLAPGARKELAINRLVEGSRKHPVYCYWTEPGDYQLRAILRLPVEVDGRTVLRTVSGPVVNIRLK